MKKAFENQNYFAIALDPIYVGTGGYRLGRVDLTIVRELGTNVPKIPGTSLAGVARAYTALAIQSENPDDPSKQKYLCKVNDKEHKSCAGKGGESGEKHCAQSDCPVCVAYGFSQERKSFQGLAQFSDIRILFFPVHSMAGPVWVTSPGVLAEHGVHSDVSENKVKVSPGMENERKLNLGWLMLEVEGTFELPENKFQFPELGEVRNKAVLISDKLFSQVVNSSLEVRTSVAISPETGAAEERALFTYEAIPRATILWFTVTLSNPEYYLIDDQAIPLKLEELLEKVKEGLKFIQYLGMGGMGTRGMGRVKVLGLQEDKDDC